MNLDSNAAHVQEGVSVEDAAFLVSVIGISNTLGRVLSGWVSDFTWVNSLVKIFLSSHKKYLTFCCQVVTNSAIILSAITVFLFPYCTSYASLVVMALLFGLFVGKQCNYVDTISTFFSINNMLSTELQNVCKANQKFATIQSRFSCVETMDPIWSTHKQSSTRVRVKVYFHL